MKKLMAGVVVIGILVVGGALAMPKAFAKMEKLGTHSSTHSEHQGNLSNNMCNDKKAWVEKAEKEGKITAEQAQVWREHFTYMEDLHSKHGMGMMGEGMKDKGMMNGGKMQDCGGAMGDSGTGGMMKGRVPGGMMNGNGPDSGSVTN